MKDYQYLTHALRLARAGLYTTAPNPRVGCVLVKDDKIIGAGWHQRAGGAHAEVDALRQAGDQARGATCYVSLEPCAHQGRTGACSTTLLNAGVKRVVYAASDPNPAARGGGAVLAAAGVQVRGGLLREQAEQINPGFHKRMRVGLPYLRFKLAASVDGRTTGTQRWLSGPQSRQDVHHWRAQSDAILTTSATVLADDPRLDVRGIEQEHLPPVKVIIDSELRVPEAAQVWRSSGQCYWCCSAALQAEAEVKARTLPNAVQILALQPQQHGLNLEQLLRELARRGCNEVWCEAGARLGASLLQQGLMDELLVYQAPHIAAGAELPMFNSKHTMRQPLQLIDQRAFGSDWRWRYKPIREFCIT